MNVITLIKRLPPITIPFRSISTEIWNKNLDMKIRKEIEDYWKKQFSYDNLFDKNNSNNKYYVLSMFPYPSGNLHMGHVRVYTISDTIARFHRMNGKNVFQPMGWDAFGLPAENAAFERGVLPDQWTRQNIEQMRNQLKSLSCTFDWDSELSTCDPRYYRWTQYIFLKMYEAGLVYQKEALVNWDPVDETVLAEEQVDEEGKSWRSGAKVEKKVLKQWFIRTTKFAKNLRDGLNDPSLVNWKDIIDVQKNWISECNGYSFELRFENSNDGARTLNVWVTNPQSILYAEFIAVKPNSMVDILAGNSDGGERQLELKVINPFTNTKIPIFVSNEVEYPFGKDVYVGIPSKSDTDKEFIQKRGLKLAQFSFEQVPTEEELCKKAQQMKIGGYPVSSKLNDWLISRQRYWGTPIPIVHCSACGSQPVPYDQLPVTLPSPPKDYSVGRGLHKILQESDWKNTTCPKCGGKAVRESDTMDTFVDSSWYYLRYPEVDNTQEPFSEKSTEQLMPVDIYIGGKEHAVLHLYYARFVSHFLHSIGLVKHREPFQQLLCQGMVKGKTYKNAEGRYFKPDEIKFKDKDTAVSKNSGEKLIWSWEKMSKSKYNGVEPSAVLEEYGVDATRLFLLFSVAPFSHRNWDSSLFSDVLTWQHRLWLTIAEFIKCRNTPLESLTPGFNMKSEEEKLILARNKCVRFTTYNYNVTRQLAAAITNLQTFTNNLRTAKKEVRKFSKEYEKGLAYFIIMLAPMAPHFAATLWKGFTSASDRLLTDCDEIKWDENVTQQKWPKLDGDVLVPFMITINSESKVYTTKLRCNTMKKLDTKSALDYALMHPTVKKYVYKKDVYDIILEKNEYYGATINIKVNNSRFYEDVDSSDSESEIEKSKS